MSIGRTIRIYLNDSSITGIRHAEIINWTGQAISCPRVKVRALTDWDESNKPGVYFLFGIDEESGEPAAYIGEAENVYSRLLQHDIPEKDFWNEAVIFTSKDENLTKSHVKYLESALVKLAKSANRYSIQNGNTPQSSSLPRSDRDSMEEFLQNLRILLGVIGHRTLEPLTGADSTEAHLRPNSSERTKLPSAELPLSEKELILEIGNISAKATMTNEGFVVRAGSKVSPYPKSSLSPGYTRLRKRLILIGTISDQGGTLTFQKDHLFPSASQAAAVIVGYSINGRRHWKTAQGIELGSMESP